MLDLYWSYVANGVVDIKTYYQTLPNISGTYPSRIASEEGPSLPVGVGDQGTGAHATDQVTLEGSEVTERGSAQELRSEADVPQPPRAGRSRSSRPSRHIAHGTDTASPKRKPGAPFRKVVYVGDGASQRMVLFDTSLSPVPFSCNPPEMHSFGLHPVGAAVDPRAWCQCGAVQRGRVPER